MTARALAYLLTGGAMVTTRPLTEDGELEAHREVILDGTVIGWLYGYSGGLWYGETLGGEPLERVTSYGVVASLYTAWTGVEARVAVVTW